MTASQLKRIRSKLAQASKLAHEANDLATAGHADNSMRMLTARAADDMAGALRDLQAWDDRMAAHAEAIARGVSS